MSIHNVKEILKQKQLCIKTFVLPLDGIAKISFVSSKLSRISITNKELYPDKLKLEYRKKSSIIHIDKTNEFSINVFGSPNQIFDIIVENISGFDNEISMSIDCDRVYPIKIFDYDKISF